MKQEQVDYLCQLFQPVKRQAQVIIELEASGWEAPNEPEGGPVKQVRVYWKYIDQETDEDIRTVRGVAWILQPLLRLHSTVCEATSIEQELNVT